MHIYIYDAFLAQKKYESTIAKIETRITDLGLSGKIIRMGAMNSITNTINDELKNNTKTIVVVGNIETLHQAVNAMAHFFNTKKIAIDTPLGFIPVDKSKNKIAHIFGIDFEENACDALSARRITNMDLGIVNNEYFLTEAKITTQKTVVEIDKNFSIEIGERGEIIITNISMDDNLPKETKINPFDNNIELLIKTKKSSKFLPINSQKLNNSVFSFKQLLIINPEKTIILDNYKEIKCPVKINIAQEKLNLIVGKNRQF